jgi:uncharacterized membrane protein
MRENSLKRHILKTISYRILGTLTTVIIAYSVGELVLKPVIYFLHERLWYKYIRIKK